MRAQRPGGRAPPLAADISVVLALSPPRRIRRRHRAAFGAPLPALHPDRERLLDAPRALYHGTRFADGAAVLAPRWAEPCVGDLWCTDEAIFLQREAGGGRLSWPLRWIDDASLLRGHPELAGKGLPL